MKVTSVTTAVVQSNFDYTFVRIDTDEGVHGTGECFMGPGLTALIRDFGDLLVGLDPTSIAACRARLMGAASGSGGASRAGLSYNAISGIDAALWDLNGKLLGVPVSRLWGGTHRDGVEVYTDLHAGGELESMDRVMRYRRPFWQTDDGQTVTTAFYWEAAEGGLDDIEAWLERAHAATSAGFRRLKFDLDVFSDGRETVDRTLSRVQVAALAEKAMQLRAELGDEVELAFDCHWRFDVPTALRIADALAPMAPTWLEDPVPPSASALAAVAAASPVPIATGENTYMLEGFAELIDHASAHVLTPDVQKVGGLVEATRVADFAARHFLQVAPHCIASPLGFLAAVHVCASASNATCLEFHAADVPFWADLVTGDAPIIAEGQAPVPTQPGIGAELDLEVVRRFSAPGEPVFDEPPVR